MKELIKNFFIFGLATITERLVALLLIPVYARIFSVSDFGVVDLIQTFVAIVAIFSSLQLETALQRFYYEYHNQGKKDFIFTIFVVICILAIFITLIGICAAPYISHLMFESEKMVLTVKVAILQIPFLAASTIATLVLRFEKRNVAFTSIIVLRVVALLSGVYLCLIQLELNVIGLFYAQLLASIIACIVSIWQIRNIFIGAKFSRNIMRLAFKYSLPQFPARIGSTVNSYANRFFILGSLSTYFVGLFSMALKFSSIVSLLHQVFMMAWNQFMFESIQSDNYRTTFPMILKIMIPVLCVPVALVTLFSKEIILMMSTTEYLEAHKYVGGLSFALVLIIFKEIVDIGPKFENKTQFLSLNFGFSLVVNILGLIFLLPVMGLAGIVMAMILSNVTLLLSSWIVSHKLHPIAFRVNDFVLYVSPVGLLSIGSMYVELSFYWRIIIAIILIFAYSVREYYYIAEYRRLMVNCSINKQ